MKKMLMQSGLWVMAALAAAALALASASAQKKEKQSAGEELTAPNLGLKLILHRDIQPDHSSKEAAEVSAVQEGSPAYFAGIQPGDRILQINGKPTRNPQDILTRLRNLQIGSRINLWVVYLVNTTGDREGSPVGLYLEDPGQGRWFSTKLQNSSNNFLQRQPLPGLREAQEELKKQLKALYDKTMAEIAVNPCQRDIRAIRDPLDALAAKANVDSPTDRLWLITSIQCLNQTDGVLPEFEATVAAMFLKIIDPCAYDPSSDYSEALKKARDKMPRRDYNNLSFMGLSKNPCFIDFLQAKLTGGVFKPRTAR